MSYANRDSFIASFLICMTFVLFSCLVALARISNMMLNRSGESGHSCLVLHLRGKIFSLSPLNILAIDFEQLPFIRLRKYPSPPHPRGRWGLGGWGQKGRKWKASVTLSIIF